VSARVVLKTARYWKAYAQRWRYAETYGTRALPRCGLAFDVGSQEWRVASWERFYASKDRRRK
jgi:hypothetical protein